MRIYSIALIVSLTAALAFAQTTAPTTAPVDANALVKKIQAELTGPKPPEAMVNPNVPHGEMLQGQISNSKIYPGTINNFSVYVPAQFDPAKPACLLIKLDGFGGNEANVLDNLIASHEIPVMIGLGIVPGSVVDPKPGPDGKHRTLRFNRTYEFDSVNDNFPNYVVNELLPAVRAMKTKNGRAIVISDDGNDRMVTGGSTGGIGSFTLAWRRPDQFRRVYSVIGTFVSMRGGHEYPAIIRKTDPKPIRIFLEDGSVDAWNPLFGSWFEQNQLMESALKFAGYDVAHAWGVHGHNGGPGAVIFPDVMRWMWRDYPKPIEPGSSQNTTLEEITLKGEAWQTLPGTYQCAAGLTANASGNVYISDSAARIVYVLDATGKSNAFATLNGANVTREAFGPDGAMYAIQGDVIIAIDQKAVLHTVASGIHGHGITVGPDGTIYVTEPGEHSDMPSNVWRISANGDKKLLDEGLSSVSGIAFSPDGALMYVAEHSTKWIYSYIVQPEGTVTDKQPYFWLHMTDIPNDSGAEDLAVDVHGNLYAATRMGIQVCDQNGRVRAILPLPTPCGPVTSLCFGGPNFDVLYATDGVHLFKRQMKVAGHPTWAKPIEYKSAGGA